MRNSLCAVPDASCYVRYRTVEQPSCPSEPDDAAIAIVAIGMSAGALEPLRMIASALPRPFRAATVIAHHVATQSILPQLLHRWTGRSVAFGAPGALLRGDSIHVCPTQRHVVVNPDATLDVSTFERLAFVRPSLDWLFESLAASCGVRAIAVILSGANRDGARGAACVSRAGGTVIVQDPATCERPEMPEAAIASGVSHELLHPCEIAAALERHVRRIDETCREDWLTPFNSSCE